MKMQPLQSSATRHGWDSMRGRRTGVWTRRSGATACLCAAMLVVLSGPFAAVGDCSPGAPVKAQIESASKKGYVVLRLFNGAEVAGEFDSFLGTWSDTMASEARYEQWRANHATVAPRFGRPLSVVTFAGDTLRGTFRGLGPAFIALRTPDSESSRPVPFGLVKSLLGTDEAPLPPWGEIQAVFADAPRLVGVVLKQGANTVVVEREQILASTGAPGGGGSGKTGSYFVVVGVALIGAALICAVVAANSASNDLSTCSNSAAARSADARFAKGGLARGPGPLARGETRRP